jgi:hypothetical protein
MNKIYQKISYDQNQKNNLKINYKATIELKHHMEHKRFKILQISDYKSKVNVQKVFKK